MMCVCLVLVVVGRHRRAAKKEEFGRMWVISQSAARTRYNDHMIENNGFDTLEWIPVCVCVLVVVLDELAT